MQRHTALLSTAAFALLAGYWLSDLLAVRRARLVEPSSDLLAALKMLHDDIADYARINHLGGFENHAMQAARAAIAKAEAIGRIGVTGAQGFAGCVRRSRRRGRRL